MATGLSQWGMVKLLSTLVALAATLSLAAPRTAAAETAPLTGAALRAACAEAKDEVYRLSVSPELTRQGATLRVFVLSRGPKHPWGGNVPNACMRGWSVSDPALARFSEDHTHLIIAADAPAGAKISISARIDDDVATTAFAVVARDAVVLTGYWTEVGDAACPVSALPVRELHFKADGTFEVTWQPFETYVDYWGDYQFDPATGAISLTPTGGNYRPTDADLNGRAAIGPDGLLRLSELFFGASRSGGASPSACGLVFKSR